MHMWVVSMQNADWTNPFQKVHVLTENPEIEDAIKVAKANVPSGSITAINYVSSAYK